jgi:predicted Zn-dependent protease
MSLLSSFPPDNRRVPPDDRRVPPDDKRILSDAACKDITARLGTMLQGGGIAVTRIWSDWIAGVRWGRNRILDAHATSDHRMNLTRFINGAESGWVVVNETSDTALEAAVRHAERIVALNDQTTWRELPLHRPLESMVTPSLFDDATYRLSGAERVAPVAQLIQHVDAAGMYSAGYLEVSAHSMALVDTAGRSRYFQYTWAHCSVTVRDPAGTGSGWAGVDWPAWSKINPAELGKIALDKCLRSRNPVRVEPGRYTTILEPQAVFDLVAMVFGRPGLIPRSWNESTADAPLNKSPASLRNGIGFSKLGDRIADPRITIGMDPMDPDISVPPFLAMETPPGDDDAYHALTYVKDGVLTALPYDRHYGALELGVSNGRPLEGAFRMSGGTTSIPEMIASTKRGILITRFSQVQLVNTKSALLRGYTRDGTWFIENGTITKPIVNLVATESPLFMLNSIEQLGVPQRIFNPPRTWITFDHPTLPAPAVVPPLKIRDFSFTSLIDAV